jgi:hypothetical protein
VKEDPAVATKAYVEARRGLFPKTREEAFLQFLAHLSSLKGRGTTAVDPRLTPQWEQLRRREILNNLTSRKVWPDKIIHPPKPKRLRRQEGCK